MKMMKLKYEKPKVMVVPAIIESNLLGDSQGVADYEDQLSKGHNSFFDRWDSNDEEQQSGFTSKNLWDD